jgi:AcrR family transcriptional regulator
MTKRSSDNTRLALLRAAEPLFAERGVDAVSLREVSVAAGQANNSAVGYHFGDREGLVDAILERHSTPIQARYLAELEALERHDALSLRAVVEILVLPIVAKLDDPDGGWAYLSLCAQLSVSPHLPLVERPVARTAVVQRLSSAMVRFARTPVALAAFRLTRLANMLYASIIDYRRLTLSGAAPPPRDVFAHDLIDALVAVVGGPPSPETLDALSRPCPPASVDVPRRPRARLPKRAAVRPTDKNPPRRAPAPKKTRR